jgi:hypothetical protein
MDIPDIRLPRRRPVNKREHKSLRIKPAEYIFADEYLSNGNNGTAAYRVAFPQAVTSISTRAQKLLASARMQNLLKERVQAMEKITQYKRETAMTELEEAIELAKNIKNPSAMIQATKLKSQLSGLLVEKHEVKVTRFDDLELEEREAALEAVRFALDRAKLSAALS